MTLTGLFHLGLLAAAFFLIRKKRIEGYLVALAYLCYLPESSFFALDHVGFEHRSYFANMLWAALVALGFQKIRFPLRYFGAGAIVVTLTLVTFMRGKSTQGFGEWTKTSVREDCYDLRNNMAGLTHLYYLGLRSDGVELVQILNECAPEAKNNWNLFGKIFEIQALPNSSIGPAVESLGKDLIDQNLTGGKLMFEASRVANEFLAETLRERLQGQVDVVDKLELLWAYQAHNLFIDRNLFASILSQYRDVLFGLKDIYQAKSAASEKEKAQRFRVAVVLSKYFEDTSETLTQWQKEFLSSKNESSQYWIKWKEHLP